MNRENDAGLDSVDRHILAELQEDGRMTNVELARRVNLSAPPCLRRVRRLEEAGIIRGYHADVDPVSLGWEITFFALVGLESQKLAVLDAFESLATAWPEVRECHMIRGGGDFLLRLVARDTAHENELTTRLTNAPSVLRVQTLQTIRPERGFAPLRTSPHQRPEGLWTPIPDRVVWGGAFSTFDHGRVLDAPPQTTRLKSGDPRALSPWRVGSGEGRAVPGSAFIPVAPRSPPLPSPR